MQNISSNIRILLIIYICSFTSYSSASEKDEVLEGLERSYKISTDCRAIKDQVYKSILKEDDYRKTIRVLKRGINFDYINDHYCMMPLSIVASGYLTKIDKETTIIVDREAIEYYGSLFARLGPSLGKYYYSDKELPKLLPKIRLPKGFIDTSKFNDN